MKFKKIDWLVFGFLLVVSLLAMKALFHPGFYTSHDGEHQMIRLHHFLTGLGDGQLPVRWAGPLAFRGFGYPLFIFTYRLPFYLGALFKGIGLSLADSVKAVFVLTYLLSGMTMYFAQKKLWQNQLAATVGALFYLWAPWRFSTILVRASLGEAVSFVFFPLIIWSVVSLYRGKGQNKRKDQEAFLIGGFSSAGLLLSHAMLTFLFLPFLIPLVGLCLWQAKKRKALIFSYLKVLLLSLGLSAYYWLPVVIERRYIMFSHVLTDFYVQQFPTLKQLIYSPWGYGFSHPGVEQDAMSFQVGIAQWLAVFTILFLLIWQWARKKRWEFSQTLIIFFVLAFFIAVFFMVYPSKPYWQLLALFFKIDFPFRNLAFTTLFSSLILGGGVTVLKKDKLLKSLVWLPIFGLLFLAFYGNRNHLRVNQYLDLSDSFYQNHKSSSNSFDEYRPRWVNPKFFPKREEPLVVLGGQAKIKVLAIESNKQVFQVSARQESTLILNTIYYPGWQLSVDGHERKIEMAIDPGLMKLSLSPGDHRVIFKFTKTWDRIIGEIATFFTLGLVIFKLKKLWEKRKK